MKLIVQRQTNMKHLSGAGETDIVPATGRPIDFVEVMETNDLEFARSMASTLSLKHGFARVVNEEAGEIEWFECVVRKVA